MIQRMGRVLRRKPDNRLARFAVLYVEGTSEDPGYGAHEDFLDEITEVAEGVRVFPAGADSASMPGGDDDGEVGGGDVDTLVETWGATSTWVCPVPNRFRMFLRPTVSTREWTASTFSRLALSWAAATSLAAIVWVKTIVRSAPRTAWVRRASAPAFAGVSASSCFRR